MDPETLAQFVDAGGNVLVAGSNIIGKTINRKRKTSGLNLIINLQVMLFVNLLVNVVLNLLMIKVLLSIILIMILMIMDK